MNRTNHLIGAIAAGCLALLAPSPAAHARHGAVTARGFAVVELFTSEGCSSCPPAESLLAELAAGARARRLEIYCLAFHVDYWDRLGWKDPFSAAAFSNRQKAYARVMRSERIYTPQMIVNGTEEFVGSDGSRAERSIERALARTGSVRVTLRVERAAASERADATATTIGYSVEGAPKKAVLHIAAIENGLVSSVTRGENAGHVLHDAAVVRAFSTVALERGADGTLIVRLPQGTVPSHTSIVGYVQDPSTMTILGATEVGATSTAPSASPAGTSGRS